MAGDRKFDPQDYAGRILLASPLLAIGIAFGVGAGANWHAEQTGRAVVSPVAFAILTVPGLVAMAGSAAGGFLVRRRRVPGPPPAAGAGRRHLLGRDVRPRRLHRLCACRRRGRAVVARSAIESTGSAASSGDPPPHVSMPPRKAEAMHLSARVAFAVVGAQALLAAVGMAREDAALGMLAGLMTPLSIGALVYAVVSRRSRWHRRLRRGSLGPPPPPREQDHEGTESGTGGSPAGAERPST